MAKVPPQVSNLDRSFFVPGSQFYKVRRSLLLSATLTILLNWMGWVPTKIQALGLDVQPSDQIIIQVGIAIVTIYFCFLFWYRRIRDKLEGRSTRLEETYKHYNMVYTSLPQGSISSGVRRTAIQNDLEKIVGSLDRVQEEGKRLDPSLARIEFWGPLFYGIIAVVGSVVKLVRLW